MFAKFLTGCLLLAALLIIGGTYVLQSETQMRSRGNFLQKSVRRLAGYVDSVGQGMTGTLLFGSTAFAITSASSTKL
jgi:hypothetical protein